MKRERKDDTPPGQPFANFTTAVGLALGELLLLMGRPEDLERCLYSIQLVALATLRSSESRLREGQVRRGPSLSGAALAVVTAWHERTEDLNGLGDAVTLLQDVLEAVGVPYVISEPAAGGPEK